MDIKLIQFQSHGDERGSLVSLEENRNIPFSVKRVYYIFDTADKVRRGFHAHRKLKQLAIVLKGSCHFLLDNGREKIELLMDSNTRGLYIEPFIWHEMFDFSDDCVLVVLADELYDEADYIRDYDEFKQMVEHDS